MLIWPFGDIMWASFASKSDASARRALPLVVGSAYFATVVLPWLADKKYTCSRDDRSHSGRF